MEHMLQKHLDLTIGEVVGQINMDWVTDDRSCDAGHRHMLMFADMLSEGIAKHRARSPKTNKPPASCLDPASSGEKRC
jgi:hypothetical protein